MENFQPFIAITVLICVTTGALTADSDLAPEEAKALEEFRPLVNSLLYQDFMKEDYYLMRYLRIEKLNLQKAKQRLIKTLEWRKAERIDDILSEDFSQVEKCIPMYWIGRDREGRPVIYQPAGSWDVRRCVLAGYSTKMNRYLIAREFEMGERLIFNSTNPAGGKVAKLYILADLNFYNLRKGACLRCIPFTTGLAILYDKYYPGSIHRASMINVPQLFESILEASRSLMSPENAKIIRVYGHNKNEWGPALTQDMELNQLPIALGGKRRLLTD